ncbi:TIGR03085 family protein [Mycobacterium frederiksbergense]|uniref:TIGR03085 family protein n=1 Tax=Mycolicibacterium frederiksbergense TaxID=117567 RepID=A0A6H0S2V0_9MYCO|nr:TIGR03085 family metal-binding protein [Mycolicibacterium frederiksbergense]MCV7044620.1 TIGR03085 family protein [Mycolicibacterium frederiksbergense]QIV81500.1 TIGR03085 family protein [Mycolicibacterium frederiksbergense]
MSIARKERAALVDTLRATGPDAPTLCAGWNTRDLAAHLVVRERRLDAAPGILVPKLAGYTARVQDQVTASTDWPDLLAQVAAGPPLYSPFILIDRFANVTEMFIHHEDVRRAGTDWEPRVLDQETTDALAGQVRMFARMTLSRAPARVSLTTRDGKVLTTAGKGSPVTVSGDPGELLLFAAGREPARVSFDGDADAIAAVQGSHRGL